MRDYIITIKTFLENKNLDELKSLMNEIDIWDLIDIFKELGFDNDSVVIFRLLSKERALQVFEQLDVGLQEHLLLSFTDEKSMEIIQNLAPDDRAMLLDELPAKVATKLLNNLSFEDRQKTADLLGYENETAGRIMTPEYISLKKHLTVKDATEKIRSIASEKNPETVYNIYITSDKRVLEGTVSLRDLLISDDASTLDSIMNTDFSNVHTHTDQEIVAKLLQDRDLLAVPVLDNENRLVGIVTVDDAMDILEEETTDDIFDKVGLINISQKETNRSAALIKGSFSDAWKARIPFLLITLFGGMLAGVVIGAFEETLESVAAVAVFIPVIMDMGGNVGTQSSTIFTRALILGQINIKNFSKHLFKEIMVGFSMGIILGILAGFIAHFWQGIPGLGIVVTIALIITITLATTLGFFIPFVLVKLGFDQAAGSDPIITTIKDISGLAIYFLLVQYFLSHLL
ncbi:magnesium transporter [Natranaerovirga hydrolytica]|uniref:Magnesium transporter MgtE n=1 Tax=Natranaerovirga hydrolytica TaxID=680378 RepID=A0A4R1ML89_9FIRM|nr:magnesium transporter [Natranaerovirga hydrolytica]TCK93357.1 magnesium transporter [Natranaerovirga hydrolytica]